MFAAINHLPHYSWYELPVNYRESSFFTLDDMHVLGDNDESSQCHHLPTNEEENEDDFGVALPEESTVQLGEEATRTEKNGGIKQYPNSHKGAWRHTE